MQFTSMTLLDCYLLLSSLFPWQFWTSAAASTWRGSLCLILVTVCGEIVNACLHDRRYTPTMNCCISCHAGSNYEVGGMSSYCSGHPGTWWDITECVKTGSQYWRKTLCRVCSSQKWHVSSKYFATKHMNAWIRFDSILVLHRTVRSVNTWPVRGLVSRPWHIMLKIWATVDREFFVVKNFSSTTLTDEN